MAANESPLQLSIKILVGRLLPRHCVSLTDLGLLALECLELTINIDRRCLQVPSGRDIVKAERLRYRSPQ